MVHKVLSYMPDNTVHLLLMTAYELLANRFGPNLGH